MYARITLNRDYPPRPQPGILHLMDIRSYEGTLAIDVDVTTPQAFAEFVAAHPEIGHVIVYDSRFPQRGRAWKAFVEKDARRIWPEAELLQALIEVQRRRVADPNYVPTVSEALRHPREFVDGMKGGA